MNLYAYMIHYWNGVSINKKESVAYFKMAIEKENPSAMNNYATIHEHWYEIEANKILKKIKFIHFTGFTNK